MHISFFVLTTLLASTPFHQRGAPAPTDACATPTTDCTAWVTLGAGPARSMIYTSYPLEKRNDRIRRALIMVHGTN